MTHAAYRADTFSIPDYQSQMHVTTIFLSVVSVYSTIVTLLAYQSLTYVIPVLVYSVTVTLAC